MVKSGETIGSQSFQGSIGKKCAEDSSLEPQVNFLKISFDIKISQHILLDLSEDQIVLYNYCEGNSKGQVDKNCSIRKIGPLNHSRWLTLKS